MDAIFTVYFSSYTLIMIGVSIMINMVSLTLNRLPLAFGPPCWIIDLTLGKVGYILGLQIFIPCGVSLKAIKAIHHIMKLL